MPTPNQRRGLIATWEDEKGYGFIEPAGGGERLFVHIKAFGRLQSRPTKGDTVLFVLGRDAKGRPRAESAEIVGPAAARKSAHPRVVPALWPTGAYFGLTFLGSFVGSLPIAVPLVTLMLSFMTYLVYGLDKRKAEDAAWRVPESTLHLLALLGGWPGAFAAQRLLRHKSRKTGFLAMFWFTVALNLLLLVCLFTPLGERALQTLFSLSGRAPQ
ncbi:MAG: cold shock and DUF1294 domain-containing protein [Armatimonadetes bacterium]|nr:cold shock and DUF1294 domain-containing protein [Armatimonadota bacterium]